MPRVTAKTPFNKYRIPRSPGNFSIDGDWDKLPWRKIAPLYINQVAGEPTAHFPQVQAKLAYDDQALYAIFHVSDRYVRATAENYQDPVYKDSCGEFFFTPGEDLNHGYFNFELNCGGIVLFHHQKGRGVEDLPISRADFEQVEIAHTLPKVVFPEVEEPLTWVVEYRLPLAILGAYAPLDTPVQGVRWRANLYKCADSSSHPHWLTWSPVDTPVPDFHRPEFFGILIFE